MGKPTEAPAAEESPTGLAELPTEDPLKARAFELYMQHVSAADISRELGVTARQISRWRTEGQWAVTREGEDRAVIEDGFQSRKLTVSRIATLTLDQLKRGLDHLARRPDPPTLAEAEKLSTIAANLDRLSRLDAGKATENINLNTAVRMSIEEIKRTVLEDPFGTHDDSSSGS